MTSEAEDTARRITERAMRYSGQIAGIAAAGLLETFEKPPRRKTFGDWLDHNDYGYPLGLLIYIAAMAPLFLQLWWLAAPMLILAFALCWWFG